MSNLRSGINVSRRIGAGGGSNITDEMRQVRTQGQVPLFQRAVAAEIFYEPSILTTDEKTALTDSVANPRAVAAMPRNSILGRVISDSNDLGDPRPRIIFPFFQSHFCLPLKAGEQVFVVYPDPHIDGHEQGYWITRVPEAATVEDLNFTHGDRRFDFVLNPGNQSTSDRAEANNDSEDSEPPAPGFPNGGNTPESLSLFVSGSSNQPYETIFTGSISNKQVTLEAISRFTKRPGELALIGSNNARLVIGEDRTGPATRVSESNQKADKIGKAGAIDMVVGVGGSRQLPESKDDNPLETDPEKRPTAPHVIENTRQKKEIDKATFLRQKQDNPKEGDPDFKRDLSRIYLSMKTAGDKNFEIKITGDTGIFTSLEDNVFSEIKDALDPALDDGDEDGQPFIVAKSEHIRLIAAGKDKEEAYGGPADHGDIRLIKEGNTDDKDLSMFIMDKAGNILAVAKNIQLVTHEEGKVFIKCKDGEEANGDPMVLYTKLKEEVLQKVVDELKKLREKTAQAFSDLGQAFSAPNAAGPFSPVPAIIQANVKCQLASNQTLGDSSFEFDKIVSEKAPKVRSKWIFVNKENQE